MTDLEQLQQYTKKDVEKTANDFWNQLSKTCSRQENPELWIIGGQPGAGKSGSKSRIEEKLNNNILSIDYDDIRATHPKAKELYLKGAQNSSDYSERTNAFAKEVGDILIQKAVENNYNVLIEKTMNKSSSIKELIKSMPNHSTNIEVVTCSAKDSINSVNTRYFYAKKKFEKDNEKNPPPRFIEPYYIEKCLKGLGKTTQEIATDPSIKLKTLKIQTRDENFIYTPLFDINAKKSQKLSTRLLESNPNKIKQIIDDAVDIKNQTMSKSKEQER